MREYKKQHFNYLVLIFSLVPQDNLMGNHKYCWIYGAQVIT